MPKRLLGGGEAARWWKRSKLEKIKWRKKRGEGFIRERVSCRVGMNEMAGAGGRGRRADERFMKGKEKMMRRAYEVGPLSS